MTTDHHLTPIILYASHQPAIHHYVQTHYLSQNPLLITLTPSSTSLTIDQIHSLHRQLAATSPRFRLVWIQQAHLATIPAQNALLKTLEEPVSNTLFLLTTTHLRQLLPTIRSRCHLLKLPPSLPPKDQTKLDFVKQVLPQNPGQRILAAKQIPSQRPQALAWTEDLLNSLHQALQTTTSQTNSLIIMAKLIKPTITLKKNLLANVNVTLAIEHFLLSLPTAKNSNR